MIRYGLLGDDLGRAATEMSLADSSALQGRGQEALKHAERALDLYERADHRPGRANALNAVGWCHALLGDNVRALTYCGRALRLHQRLDDRRGAGNKTARTASATPTTASGRTVPPHAVSGALPTCFMRWVTASPRHCRWPGWVTRTTLPVIPTQVRITGPGR